MSSPPILLASNLPRCLYCLVILSTRSFEKNYAGVYRLSLVSLVHFHVSNQASTHYRVRAKFSCRCYSSCIYSLTRWKLSLSLLNGCLDLQHELVYSTSPSWNIRFQIFKVIYMSDLHIVYRDLFSLRSSILRTLHFSRISCFISVQNQCYIFCEVKIIRLWCKFPAYPVLSVSQCILHISSLQLAEIERQIDSILVSL